ncbi:CHAT domain-containing protein [Arthrobacter alpinus]|uniref:CHAT domain-containing protein n=1 Tax=Arthrobacter alpinus TaxID=656366 RepID=A0A1H5LRL1_9MICC|nr:CHAT domain-containing protein [Arthrobacter alpinus]SEE78828.1 CHAT domain-containing protein [Arthrobacter alpinus]
MNSFPLDDFLSGRRVWFNAIVERIVDSRVRRTFSSNVSNLSSAEMALLTTHVGLGHIYGILDSDAEVAGFLSKVEVEQIISRHWREGHFDRRLATHLLVLWQSIYRLGRDLGQVRPELLVLLHQSQLGARERSSTEVNLEPHYSDVLIRYLLVIGPVVPLPLPKDISVDLDCSESHLSMLRGLFKLDRDGISKHVTWLELLACWPDDAEDEWKCDALRASSNQILLPKSMHGGWPNSAPSGIPGWVADTVATSGARICDASSGFVPSWLIVAESEDQMKAIRQWSYEPTFFHGIDGENVVLLGIPLTLSGIVDVVRATWAFDLEDSRSLNSLRTLLSIGAVRIDIYKIDAHASLEYVYSFGCRLPPELVGIAYKHLAENEPNIDDVKMFTPLSQIQRLRSMAHVEQQSFEMVRQGLMSESGSDLHTAFRHYLEIIDATTLATFSGYPVDPNPPREAREEFLIAIASSGSQHIDELDLSELGPGRGYVQITMTRDSPILLVANAAYLNADLTVAVVSHEFAGPFDTSWSYEKQNQELSKGFDGLKELLDAGINKLVVNAHSTAYNLTYHEAFLRLGFIEVSYTHRAASLRHRERPAEGFGVTCGFPGEGQDLIKAVDTELDFVDNIYHSTRVEFLPTKLPRTVHLAGHGYSGARSYEVGLAIHPSEPLSSARILLDLDASATDLVYLSACSTGRGTFHELQLAETIPLDIAFLEKGARAVLSTSAPVNDSVACFFACVFHHARSGGQTIWNSYSIARHASEKRKIPRDQTQLRKMLDVAWPLWEKDLHDGSKTYPYDWQLFRVSGRHWE